MEELKIWRCGKGHALGVVRRAGNGVQQLLLYRHAISMGSTEAVDVMAVVEGSVMDIRCEICGGMRTWAIGQAAFEKLMAHFETAPLAMLEKRPAQAAQRREGKSQEVQIQLTTDCTDLTDIS
jgi:hypothetical protein